MDFRLAEPGDHELAVRVGKVLRPFRLHVPKDVKRNLNPVIAFDGLVILNPKGSMGRINGLDEASEKHKFAAIYAVPKTRYLGIAACWNTPGGYLAWRSSYDDLDYVREIFAMLAVEKVFAIGFSAGAQFAHILAGRLVGKIAGVGSICGTWLGTEPTPPAGTRLLAIHGEADPVQPYNGGRPSFKVTFLANLGNPTVLASRPNLQAKAYARANGFGLTPTVEETKYFFKRTYGAGTPPVIEYLMRSPYGGHTYHGRMTGEGSESVLSRKHGRPLPASIFSVNDIFAATMGLAGDLKSDIGRAETA